MTNEEVVKWLEWAEMVYKNAYKGTTGGGEIHEAMQTAIEALEKQIPKKPTSLIINNKHNSDYCAFCDMEISVEWMFCPHCGQRIDWSDTK